MSKVLVTGADGFIGSHLVEALVKSGKQVKAFSLYNSHNNWGWLEEVSPEIMKEVEVFTGDIRDPFGVEKSMEGVCQVYHLASLIGIPYSYHSPATYVDTNISGTLNILQAARKLDISKVVHTSTSEVYGSALYVPIDEKHPLQGQSPYSATKIGADQMALSFYRSFDTPVSICRPFNTYGPRQSARAVIPTIISQLAKGKSVKLGSLTPTRDFNFVEDTVRGFISIGESDKSLGEVINIGSNFEISIGETLNVIKEVMGRSVDLSIDNERVRPDKSEVERLYSCNKKAKELLDWSPQFGGLDGFKEGIKITAEWFTNEKNLKKYKTDIYNI